MKKTCLIMILALASFSVFANDLVVESFLGSNEVKEAIIAAKKKGLIVEEEPQQVYLRGGCGYAGCTDQYLVTLKNSTDWGANNQYSSIAAVVTITPIVLPKVEIIKVKSWEEGVKPF